MFSSITLTSLYKHALFYRSPLNLSYLWNFGSLAGLCLVIQIASGIFLAMHYTPHVDLAFYSVEHIMRDVPYGWILRYVHANGASFFFIVVYAHIFRGIYYSSFTYPRIFLWFSGVVIFILLMAIAFLGYVLPWGQMSFWGATVITNLFSAFPIIGDYIVYWLWGGFAVDNATLNRFFSLHFFLPFILAAVAFVHLLFLHENGSSNPVSVSSPRDNIFFVPYYTSKDLLGVFILFIFFFAFVFFSPNTLGHPDNYIPANPLSTPAHIVPEWYFLPFYAILRSIPHKLGGVLFMFFALLVWLVIPFVVLKEHRNTSFKAIERIGFWFFFFVCVLLGWIGGQVPEYPYVELGQFCTFFYFFYFLAFIPVMSLSEFYLSSFVQHAFDTVRLYKTKFKFFFQKLPLYDYDHVVKYGANKIYKIYFTY